MTCPECDDTRVDGATYDPGDRFTPAFAEPCPVCDGGRLRCEGCDEPDHDDEVGYDDCVRAHQPDAEDQCACPCMDNYEPTDEQLWAYQSSARRGR